MTTRVETTTHAVPGSEEKIGNKKGISSIHNLLAQARTMLAAKMVKHGAFINAQNESDE